MSTQNLTSSGNFDPLPFRSLQPAPPSKTFVGRIRQSKAIVTTNEGEVPVVVSGEVVLDGQVNDGRFEITAWRRVALVGRPQDRDTSAARSIGIISLVGPIGEPAAEAALDQINLQLHYEALSTRLPQHVDDRSTGVRFPEVETSATSVEWAAESDADGPVTLTLNMTTEQARDNQVLGLVTNIGLNALTAQLVPIRDEPYHSLTHHSLTGSCADPDLAQPLGREWQPTITRLVPLVFVSLCKDFSERVQQVCENQLRTLCAAWRFQGALDYILRAAELQVPALADDVETYHILNDGGLSDLRTLWPRPDAAALVYFVDSLELAQHEGGAVTIDSGVGSTYCVIDVQKADAKPYLLAHEIGHVLGLDDPNGNRPNLVRGEANTVMDVSALIHTRNRLSNCHIFSDRLEARADGTVLQRPHNPIVMTTEFRDYFRPDL